MLYITPPINTFSLCSITVNSELAHLWIRLLKSLYRIKEMEKKVSEFIFYPVLWPWKGMDLLKKKQRNIHVITIKLNTMQSFIIIFSNGLQAALWRQCIAEEKAGNWENRWGKQCQHSGQVMKHLLWSSHTLSATLKKPPAPKAKPRASLCVKCECPSAPLGHLLH